MALDSLLSSLSMLAVRLPMLIAYAVAAVYAVARWEKHPQVSMLVVIAVGVLALDMIAAGLFYAWMPMRLRNAGRGAAEVGVILSTFSAVTAIINAGCWGMLIAAIFGWRSESASRSPQR
ncbi:MAG: hypothetical protein ACYC8T_17280 [Myxococcaceae bacterium]